MPIGVGMSVVGRRKSGGGATWVRVAVPGCAQSGTCGLVDEAGAGDCAEERAPVTTAAARVRARASDGPRRAADDGRMGIEGLPPLRPSPGAHLLAGRTKPEDRRATAPPGAGPERLAVGR